MFYGGKLMVTSRRPANRRQGEYRAICPRKMEEQSFVPFSHISYHMSLLINFISILCEGISEWSILVTILASSIVFTSINLMAEFIFKLVNNQNQVLHTKYKFLLWI